MSGLRAAVLVAAALTTGLMAGVFGLYQHTIMRGLRRTDDRTFVGAFQAMDRAIINPWFMASFLGALVFTTLAAVLHIPSDVRAALPWVLVALVLYAAVVAVTMIVNVPMNDALKAAGDPDRIADLGEVRRRFDEAKWVRFNLFRTLASTVAFVLLLWALVVHGSTT